MSVTLRVNGGASVARALRAIGDRAERAAANVVSRYVDLIAREARGLAPLDTGELRASIRGELQRLRGFVIAGAEHAFYPEFGLASNPNYPVQPYMAPAFEVHRAGFVRDLRAALRRASR